MAAELGLLSLTHHQLQKVADQQPHPPSSSWMWKPNRVGADHQEDDDSWEIRAFEQDTGNINGTTWPPRSYTCTFCRREFRSAQALGGHMNVHRRDRARLHHQAVVLHHPAGTINNINNPAAATSSSSNFPPSSTLLIPAPEFVTTNGGLCLLYSLANPNGTVMSPTTMNSCMDSPSKPTCPPSYNTNHPPTPHSLNSSICHSTNTEPTSASNNTSINDCNSENKKDSAIDEELDLELRLGRGR